MQLLSPAAMQKVSLREARAALCAQLHPHLVEVSVSGDFSEEVVEELTARYLGQFTRNPLQFSHSGPLILLCYSVLGSLPARPSPSDEALLSSECPFALRAAAIAAASPAAASALAASAAESSIGTTVARPVKSMLASPFLPPVAGGLPAGGRHLDITVPDRSVKLESFRRQFLL